MTTGLSRIAAALVRETPNGAANFRALEADLNRLAELSWVPALISERPELEV